MKFVLFVMFLAITAFGQAPSFEGAWKLDHKLSNFGGFTPPQTATIVFSFEDYGQVSMCTVSALGQLSCSSHVFNGDGVLYDKRVAVKKMNREFSTAEAVYYRNGQISTRRWFAVRGDTLTVITNVINNNGEVTAIVTLVYKKE